MFKRLFINFCITVCSFFAIFNRSATKRHVMMVALAVFIAIGTVIIQPSTVKAFPFITWQETTKFFNSSLEDCEFETEENINVFRPVYRDWINIFKSNQDNITELFRGISESINPMNLESDETPDENGEDAELYYIINHLILLLLIFYMYFYNITIIGQH